MKAMGLVLGAVVVIVAVGAVAIVSPWRTTEASGPTGLRQARHCTSQGNGTATCQPPAGETWFVTAVGVDPGGAAQTGLSFTDGATDWPYLGGINGVLSYVGAEFPITNDFYLRGTGSNPTKLVVLAYTETKAAQAVGGVAGSPTAAGGFGSRGVDTGVIIGGALVVIGAMAFGAAAWRAVGHLRVL